MKKEIQEHCFPLSLSQQNIWNLERAFPGTSVNNISTTIRISGQLDFPLLQESIHRVLEKDASMNTRIVERDGEMVQYHTAYVREDFPIYDFCNTSKEGIENWETAVTRELIRLEDGPLYRFVLFRDGESSGGVLVKLHHIIADGWSQIMICNRIGQTYLQLLEGKEPDLEQAPDYELHVQEEQKYLASKAFQKDESYWKKILEQSGEPSVLKAVNSAAVSPVGRRLSFELPQVLNHAIYSYCQEKRVAPFAVFYMALAVYFKRIGGADRFTIGVPIFNRTNYQFKQSTGMFVTTLPFYNEINDEWTLNRFNDELMEKWYEMLRHQRYPYSYITKLAGEEGRLFHIALSYQDSKIFENRNTSVMFSGRWHYCGYQAEQLTIHLTNLMDHQRYAVDYDYLAQFFTEEEITRLHNSLCDILNEALSEPDKPIHRLHVLTIAEKEKLLYTFNDTKRYLAERSVYEALVLECGKYQNRVAVICDGERMTYGALLHRSAQFAVALAKRDVEAESLIAVLLPRKFDLLAAMVGILQADCSYMILSEELPTERIRHILKQSGAAALITGTKGEKRLCEMEIPVICAEEVGSNGEVLYVKERDVQKELPSQAERLAYVVYTSGSTGEPKGVEITQRNLLNLAQEMAPVYGQGAVLSVCNVGFDAFMLESIVALLNGRTVVFPSDSDLESPERLATLINGHAVGFFSMTPSRLSAFLQSKAFCKVMWRMESIVCGGEAFPAELLKKLKKLSHARIYNQYGPSETTVGVSMKELSEADRITAGHPMGNCRLYVLDQWMNPLPVGGLGYLYVGGECVGRGYRNQPELTGKYFRDNPFVTDDRIYFTGDIASWTAEGEIVLTGRMDKQVKLRGLRVEPQEVSSCIESYPGITAAVARVCEVNGQMVLGAYYCSEEPVNESGLMAHAATYLPRYMIPTFLIRLKELPISANGKVDEKRLPLPEDRGGEQAVALSQTAERILNIFRTVLHCGELYGSSDYFLAGGNSLNAMECIMEIEEQLGRKVRIADLYACRNAVRLAALLDGDTQSTVEIPVLQESVRKGIQKAPACSVYPLTSVQQGMYVQSVLDSSGFSYNMPGAFLLEMEPDREKLENAFCILMKEEPLFRTVFVQEKDGIVARVLEEVPFCIAYLEAEDFTQACHQFLRPFDLTKAPLLRAALWQSPENQWYLFLDSHHIIGDGMSTPLILQRLDDAYSKGTLQIRLNYYDYIYAVQQEQVKGSCQQELEYWVEHLKEIPEPLVLPGDFARPKNFDFKGKECELQVTGAEKEAYDHFCKENGISEFSLFLAAYGILLSAISGREDFMIGVPVAGRTLPGTGEICGPFINTLPLRLRPEHKKTVWEWLEDVQTEVTGMLDHQQVSLEEIIQALNLPRGQQNALYQVMMSQSPVDEDTFSLGGHKMQYQPISTGAVKMDLIMEVARKGREYAFRFSYATGVFLEETIHFYGRCFKQILQEMIRGKDTILEKLRLMSAEDYQTYVEEPNYRVSPFVNLPIHKLLRNKTMSMENETAVIFQGNEVTFAQLERRAAAIADFLEKQGVMPGQCVGLCLSRTPDMIAAMYGVLKAGCAYVFMLPDFPTARIQYMLETSKAGIMLYDKKARESMPADLAKQLPCSMALLPEGEADSYMDRPIVGDQLANVLFTSGSTGKPKGVMLKHRGVSNMYTQVKSLLDPIEGKVLCSTNSVFDCFMVETLIVLAMGRTVVLADEEEMMLPWKLAQLIEKYQIAVFEMTPARLQMCLGNEAFCKAAHNIRIAMVGGEAMTRTIQQKFYEHCDGILLNMYGPSESTVYTTMIHVKPDDHITIGRPMQNIRTYVLNEDMRPVIPTACGELYIAGECLAAGYISRPDLTEQAFVEDIYFPGEKMYKSGDMVRLRLDGTFDFIGRKDAQVKLNGQRVELSEINGAILESGQAKQAATVAVRKADGSMELCAFYEPISTEKEQEEIWSYMRRVLPVYMIPSRLVALERMPMTASNKINMLELQQRATEGISHEVTQQPMLLQKQQPVKLERVQKVDNVVTPAYILSIWNRVLSIPAANPEVSFFEQGGTSMAALNVLSYFYNDHLEMSLSEFYENPTAVQQSQLLNRDNVAHLEREVTVENVQIFEQVEFPLEVSDADEMQLEKEHGAVLVTGATGFFGAHLVKALLAKGEQKVICLMRDGSEERLRESLAWYFGQGFLMGVGNRIEVVQGDIACKQLGMTDTNYRQLADKISEVYHCAADVRHYAFDEENYLNTNVGGTANMLELAKLAGASFYHMSTCSVSGDAWKEGAKPKAFTEEDYDIGQAWENNIYVKSKYLAEGLVLKAAKEGLNVKIFRLGRLVGRASDGVFQKNPQNNVFYLLMKGFHQIGAIPEIVAQVNVDLMPIDVCAEEVLALRDSEGMIYHIMSHIPVTLEETVKALDERIQVVAEDVFIRILQEKSQNMDQKLLAIVMNHWYGMKNGQDEIIVTNTLTMEALSRKGYHPVIPSARQILQGFPV